MGLITKGILKIMKDMGEVSFVMLMATRKMGFGIKINSLELQLIKLMKLEIEFFK